MAMDRRRDPRNPNQPLDPTAPQGRLYVGTQTGAFVSTDDGRTWRTLGVGLPNVPVTDIQFSPEYEKVVVATQGAGSFQLSTDRIGPRLLTAIPNLDPTNPATQPNPANVPVGPDTSAGQPADPVWAQNPGLDSVVVTFTEPVDPRTFTLGQVRSFTGPNGPITILSIEVDNTNVVPGDEFTRYIVRFPRQTSDGIYRLTIGPGIQDFLGNSLDVNQNRVPGELPGDLITMTFVINTSDNGRFVSGNFHDLLGGRADTEGFISFLGAVDEARLQSLERQGLALITSYVFPGSGLGSLARGNLIAGFYGIDDDSSVFRGTGSWLRASDTLFIGNFLRRDASDAEVQRWIDRLNAGGDIKSINDVIAAIVSSLEYYTRDGLAMTNDDAFLRRLYDDLLGRPADTTGLNNWANRLRQLEESARTSIAGRFTNSQEYRINEVTALFLKYLGRLPSPAELTGNVNAIAAGRTFEQTIAVLVGSPEYFARNRSNNDAWLTGAYRDILNRSPDVTGRASFLAQLNAGVSRQAIAMAMLSSLEYKQLVVKTAFRQLLPPVNGQPREPTAAELNHFVGFLQRGERSERIIDRVVALQEYFDANDGDQPDRLSQNNSWVASVYENVLGRTASAAEITGHVNELNRLEGLARAQIVKSFLVSGEFINREVQVVYAKDLGRTASSSEVNLWVPLLSDAIVNRGEPSPQEEFLSKVLASSEYLQRQRDANGQTHGNRSWVDAVFRDVLGITDTSVDLAGRDAAFTAILAGYEGERLAVSSAMAASEEYRRRLVAGYYQTYLRRVATSAEIAAGAQRLLDGARDEEIIRDLVASPEYFNNPARGAGNNSLWLDSVYLDLLGRNRAGQGQGFLNFLNDPNNPKSALQRRQEVALSILRSAEYRDKLVNQFYVDYLGRAASQAERDLWRGNIERGLTNEQVIARIISSKEYFVRPHRFP
jgi:hypothetical protein